MISDVAYDDGIPDTGDLVRHIELKLPGGKGFPGRICNIDAGLKTTTPVIGHLKLGSRKKRAMYQKKNKREKRRFLQEMGCP